MLWPRTNGSSGPGLDDCERARRWLASAAGPTGPVADHLRRCVRCAHYAGTLRRLQGALRHPDQAELTASIETVLRQATLTRRDRGRRPGSARLVRAGLAAAAAVAGLMLMRPGTLTPPSGTAPAQGLEVVPFRASEPESTRTDILRPPLGQLRWRTASTGTTESGPPGLFEG